jgi:hypothetical protein
MPFSFSYSDYMDFLIEPIHMIVFYRILNIKILLRFWNKTLNCNRLFFYWDKIHVLVFYDISIFTNEIIIVFWYDYCYFSISD